MPAFGKLHKWHFVESYRLPLDRLAFYIVADISRLYSRRPLVKVNAGRRPADLIADSAVIGPSIGSYAGSISFKRH